MFFVFGKRFFQDTGNGEVKKTRSEKSVSDVYSKQRDEIMKLYKLQMPEDLYLFWDFCKELCPDDPRGKLIVLFVFFTW